MDMAEPGHRDDYRTEFFYPDPAGLYQFFKLFGREFVDDGHTSSGLS